MPFAYCDVTLDQYPDPRRLDVFDEPLQGRHPAGRQVAVLEEHPLPTLHGCMHHGLSPGALGRRVNKQINITERQKTRVGLQDQNIQRSLPSDGFKWVNRFY